jgi:hypothetical protein
MTKMWMFGKPNTDFKIRSHVEIWGFDIDVVDRNGKVLQSYYVHQRYNWNDGSPDSVWQLKRQSDHIYDNPLLTGRLVSNRTDPFSPLIKCMQFLNEQGQRRST